MTSTQSVLQIMSNICVVVVESHIICSLHIFLPLVQSYSCLFSVPLLFLFYSCHSHTQATKTGMCTAYKTTGKLPEQQTPWSVIRLRMTHVNFVYQTSEVAATGNSFADEDRGASNMADPYDLSHACWTVDPELAGDASLWLLGVFFFFPTH